MMLKKNLSALVMLGFWLSSGVSYGQPSMPARPPVSIEQVATDPLPQEPLPDSVLVPDSKVATGSDWENVRDIFFSKQLDEKVTVLFPTPNVSPTPPSTLPNATSVITIPDHLLPPVELNALPKERVPRLSGIMFSSDNDKSAIIDGAFFKEGESVQGYRLVQIRKNSVLLKRNKEERVIYVQP